MTFFQLTLILSAVALKPVAAETFVVEGGQSRAEIIIAVNPSRTVRLAAGDLQTYLQKIRALDCRS